MQKPDILLIEDDEKARTSLAKLLQAKGAHVRLAANDDEGVRTFYRYASSIDAVLTDLRLRGDEDDDYSGGEMALKISQAAPKVPLFCVSGFENDAEARFPFFRKCYKKGKTSGPKSVLANLDEIVGSAIAFDSSRFETVPPALIAMKKKYEISDTDFIDLVGNKRLTELEDTALLLQSALEAADAVDQNDVDDVPVAIAEIILVPAGTFDGEEFQLKRNIPIVLEQSDNLWIAELFGFPLVYTYADKRDEAISSLVKLLFDYKGQIANGELMSREGRNFDYIRFATFLDMLFA